MFDIVIGQLKLHDFVHDLVLHIECLREQSTHVWQMGYWLIDDDVSATLQTSSTCT